MDTKVKDLVSSAIGKIHELSDADTVIGKPIKIDGGITVIPVSKVSYGFGSGGTDLPSKSNADLFGGGGGGGITIQPVAFIVIENGKCRMMQINNYTSSADRAIAMIPELVDKVTELLKSDKTDESKAEEAAE